MNAPTTAVQAPVLAALCSVAEMSNTLQALMAVCSEANDAIVIDQARGLIDRAGRLLTRHYQQTNCHAKAHPHAS